MHAECGIETVCQERFQSHISDCFIVIKLCGLKACVFLSYFQKSIVVIHFIDWSMSHSCHFEMFE